MSSGVYGTKRAADVDVSDIEIFMHYTPDRNTENNGVIKLDTEEMIMTSDNPNGVGNEILPGMYTLKLPKEYFSTKGFYTLLIRPKEIRTKITDIGNLSAQPDVRGIVFDINSLDEEIRAKFENGELTGYRIEYLDRNNSVDPKIRNVFRIITSNNRCEPVNQDLANTAQKAIRYRFNDSGTLSFCTVTPNSASLAKPNVIPFIGSVEQDVILSNTHFDPILMEIEMVDYDIEDLAIGVFGTQSKSVDNGLYTIYNFEREIYKQYDIYEIKDKYTDEPLYEVKEERDEIDFDQSLDDITRIDEE